MLIIGNLIKIMLTTAIILNVHKFIGHTSGSLFLLKFMANVRVYLKYKTKSVKSYLNRLHLNYFYNDIII